MKIVILLKSIKFNINSNYKTNNNISFYNDKNQQASSQKFKQLITYLYYHGLPTTQIPLILFTHPYQPLFFVYTLENIQFPGKFKSFAGQPTLVCPCVGVHKRMSLISSSLLIQQCPAFVDLTRMVCVIVLDSIWYEMSTKSLFLFKNFSDNSRHFR